MGENGNGEGRIDLNGEGKLGKGAKRKEGMASKERASVMREAKAFGPFGWRGRLKKKSSSQIKEDNNCRRELFQRPIASSIPKVSYGLNILFNLAFFTHVDSPNQIFPFQPAEPILYQTHRQVFPFPSIHSVSPSGNPHCPLIISCASASQSASRNLRPRLFAS